MGRRPRQIKATFERLVSRRLSASSSPASVRSTDSEVVYHSVKEELSKLGVVFMGTDQALKEYPDIFKKYFATVVPAGGQQQVLRAERRLSGPAGASCTCPRASRCLLPLQAYFRINGENHGQFRAHAYRRRRRRQGALHRGLYIPHLCH